jgi:hypothetical protein
MVACIPNQLWIRSFLNVTKHLEELGGDPDYKQVFPTNSNCEIS